MTLFGDLYNIVFRQRQALRLWNNGQPLVSAENAEFVSLYCAPKWASKVHEMDMGFQGSNHTKKKPANLAMVVCVPFWEAMLERHLDKHAAYFERIFEAAAAHGNLSVLQATVNVRGLSKTMADIDGCPTVHPRVLGWQHAQRHAVSKAHVLDYFQRSWWDTSEYQRDDQLFVEQHRAMVSWIMEWVELPDACISASDGYAMACQLNSVLDSLGIVSKERDGNGFAVLNTRHVAMEPIAGMPPIALQVHYISAMLEAVYKRFSFDPVLMDTVVGRWTSKELEDPKICTVIDFMQKNNSWQQRGRGWSATFNKNPYEETNAEQWRQYIVANNLYDEVVAMSLDLQAEPNDGFSVYEAALPCFRQASSLEVLALPDHEVSSLFV